MADETMRNGEAPRPRRRGWLLAPAVALAVFLLACSAGWLYARARIDRELDARTDALRRAGWTVTMQGRRWGGFPFRLKLTQARTALLSPSGWGVEAPGLEAQAVIFDPVHWVFAAPHGLALHRGAAGVLQVEGRALSASVSGVARTPWRVAMVGEGLRLTPAPGAGPTAFRSIGRWEAYLRPAPDRSDPGSTPGSGDGEALWQLTDARATPKGLIWRLATDAPATVVVSGRLTRLSAAAGDGWGSKVRAWSAAGGALKLDRVEARAGATRLWARGGALAVGADGRLVGAVPLEVRQAPLDTAGPAPARAAHPGAAGAAGEAGEALDAARHEDEHSSTHLVFESGVVRLGGLKLGPSPRIG